jgi:uncharacterized OB-fold protein
MLDMSPTEAPLPLVTADDEAFWTGGRTGQLRIQRCDRCGAYQHPPSPRCRTCTSAALTAVATSGMGSVYSYTVVAPRGPVLEPTVVAVIELAEQAGLRVLSNVTGCAPERLRVGLPVEVCFVRREDVWLPQFRPVER